MSKKKKSVGYLAAIPALVITLTMVLCFVGYTMGGSVEKTFLIHPNSEVSYNCAKVNLPLNTTKKKTTISSNWAGLIGDIHKCTDILNSLMSLRH